MAVAKFSVAGAYVPHRNIRNTRGEVFIDRKEDVNMLIIGEIGVGKSTWINGIANYTKYTSLQHAMNDSEITVLIPSRFTYTNDAGEELDIAVGSDLHTVLRRPGQSATQFPQEHIIETHTARFHLIDTPGIGDCRGIEKDMENFKNILAFLNGYDKINAVVVLLKPNKSRMTVAFRLCVSELLTHLHKYVTSKIIFAFTNSRGTFYRPGDSLPVLRRLLKEKDIDTNISPETYFCFDNEAFRFLACHKRGVHFTRDDVCLFSNSWDRSRDTTFKLLDLVSNDLVSNSKLQPACRVLSPDEAENRIIAISKPMGEAMQLILLNLNTITDFKDQRKLCDADIMQFQADLRFKWFERKINQLNYPMTVCADEKCRKYVNIGNSKEREAIYPQICHDHCNLTGVPLETTNNDNLRNCDAMSRNENCRKCGCSYRSHMHMTYTTTLKEKEFLSDEARAKINKHSNMKEKTKAFIIELDKCIKQLEEEKKYIINCASHFRVFLTENTQIHCNDSFSDYLDMLIKDEEAKEREIRDERRIIQLKRDKQTYEEKKEIITEEIIYATSGGNNDVISLEKISQMIHKLCYLAYIGKTLKEALDARERIYNQPDSISGRFQLGRPVSSPTFFSSALPGGYIQASANTPNSNDRPDVACHTQ